METDQRHSTRKALKTIGQLVPERSPPLNMRIINVARDGMAIASNVPVIEGAHCRVLFNLTVDGKTCQIAAGAKVIFCVYAGHSEFKSGLRFVELDSPATEAIVGFLSH